MRRDSVRHVMYAEVEVSLDRIASQSSLGWSFLVFFFTIFINFSSSKTNIPTFQVRLGSEYEEMRHLHIGGVYGLVQSEIKKNLLSWAESGETLKLTQSGRRSKWRRQQREWR